MARGITLHTAVKDDDSEAVGIIRALLAGEENGRLRAAHWLHERGNKGQKIAIRACCNIKRARGHGLSRLEVTNSMA